MRVQVEADRVVEDGADIFHDLHDPLAGGVRGVPQVLLAHGRVGDVHGSRRVHLDLGREPRAARVVNELARPRLRRLSNADVRVGVVVVAVFPPTALRRPVVMIGILTLDGRSIGRTGVEGGRGIGGGIEALRSGVFGRVVSRPCATTERTEEQEGDASARIGPRHARVPAAAKRTSRTTTDGTQPGSESPGRRRALQSRSQFSRDRPCTRPNSSSLSVTTVQPSASAWAAISRSLAPIGRPARSRPTRRSP